MTLAAHSIIGATTAGVLASYPPVGIALAFISHFILDAIPHSDYRIFSLEEAGKGNLGVRMRYGREWALDIARIGADFILGTLIAFLLFQFIGVSFSWVALAGGVAAALPDAFQFIYGLFPNKILGVIQSIHDSCHHHRQSIKISLLAVVIPQLLGTVIISSLILLNIPS